MLSSLVTAATAVMAAAASTCGRGSSTTSSAPSTSPTPPPVDPPVIRLAPTDADPRQLVVAVGERVAMRDIGSPQAFQTGETFRRAPLIDYQHPHDLIMSFGARYQAPWHRLMWRVSGAIVGAPRSGPVAFMHRSSAADNPQAPLSHH